MQFAERDEEQERFFGAEEIFGGFLTILFFLLLLWMTRALTRQGGKN